MRVRLASSCFDNQPLIFEPGESSRITAAGGFIEYGRVNGMSLALSKSKCFSYASEGNLALSRAIGDFEFKKNYSLAAERQIITADPDVTSHDLTEEDEFLILACDGALKLISSLHLIDVSSDRHLGLSIFATGY